MFNLQIKDNSVIEITNLLASNDFISISIVNNIFDKYKIKNKTFYSLQIYSDFMYCHINKNIDFDKTNIDKLQSVLLLTDNDTLHIRTNIIQQIIRKIIEDRLLTPEEDKYLIEVCNSLNIQPSFNDEDEIILDDMRKYWQLTNSDNLDGVEFGDFVKKYINLQKDEKCYFIGGVTWNELRTKTQAYNYSGISTRIKLTKGIYYNLGQRVITPVKEDVLTRIDTGLILLTNKRIVFNGTKNNKTIPIPSIITFQSYTNGIELEKATGKSPYITFESYMGSDLFSILLTKIINL